MKNLDKLKKYINNLCNDDKLLYSNDAILIKHNIFRGFYYGESYISDPSNGKVIGKVLSKNDINNDISNIIKLLLISGDKYKIQLALNLL